MLLTSILKKLNKIYSLPVLPVTKQQQQSHFLVCFSFSTTSQIKETSIVPSTCNFMSNYPTVWWHSIFLACHWGRLYCPPPPPTLVVNMQNQKQEIVFNTFTWFWRVIQYFQHFFMWFSCSIWKLTLSRELTWYAKKAGLELGVLEVCHCINCSCGAL